MIFAFTQTGDIQSFVKLVNALSCGVYYRNSSLAEAEKVEDEEEPVIRDFRGVTGHIIKETIKDLRKDLQFSQKLHSLLQVLL